MVISYYRRLYPYLHSTDRILYDLYLLDIFVIMLLWQCRLKLWGSLFPYRVVEPCEQRNSFLINTNNKDYRLEGLETLDSEALMPPPIQRCSDWEVLHSIKG